MNDHAVRERNAYLEQELARTKKSYASIVSDMVLGIVLAMVFFVFGFILGRNTMTESSSENIVYSAFPMMEERDSYDDELLRVIPFNQFVDLYPRLVERSDKDFVKKAIEGKRIEAIARYFIRKPDDNP